MDDVDEQRLDQINFLLSLLGRKKQPMVYETCETDYQFENMLNLIGNYESQSLWYTATDNNTKTVTDQAKVEKDCYEIYNSYVDDDTDELPLLQREKHLAFLNNSIKGSFPGSFVSLDASRNWIVYWIYNSILLLGNKVAKEEKEQIGRKIIAAVNRETGGIGGGFGQLGHVASSYCSLLALSFADSPEFWSQLDRKQIYSWLIKDLKQEDGSFIMHLNGEKDTRAVYCALTVASMLNIVTPELIESTCKWISKCQTYEGGFAGLPNNEAHGGYTFCAVASLCLLGDPFTMLTKYCNLDKLIEWTVAKQMSVEGGFSGRSNKLVDGCYSHWVGGVFPFLEIAIQGKIAHKNPKEYSSLFSRNGLQNYILGCCQDTSRGGLRDKPGCRPDFYHTNYTLLGLSHCQHRYRFDYNKYEKTNGMRADAAAWCYISEEIKDYSEIIEQLPENTVLPVNPVFGTVSGHVEKMHHYFAAQDE